MLRLRPEHRGLVGLLVALLLVGGILLLASRDEPHEQFSSTDSGDVLEEEGKVNAAATATVKSLAQRYGDDLRILALERHRVEDYDLIGEIFPEFPRGTIGCIIVARAGNQGAVFVEDPQLEIIHEESLDTFIERTRDLDPKLLAAFYLSLA
jgi:hypothetical protein